MKKGIFDQRGPLMQCTSSNELHLQFSTEISFDLTISSNISINAFRLIILQRDPHKVHEI